MESSWSCLGSLEVSWNALGELLEAFEVQNTLLGSALGQPKGTLEIGFELPGGQMASQKGARRIQQSSSRDDSCSKRDVSKKQCFLMLFCDFLGFKPTFRTPKQVQNGFRIASSTRKPSESLLGASWNALGAEKSKLESLLGRSWRALGLSYNLLARPRPPG